MREEDGNTDHHGTHGLSYASNFELESSVFFPDLLEIKYRTIQMTF